MLRCAQSFRSNVRAKYASAEPVLSQPKDLLFACLASENFLSSLRNLLAFLYFSTMKNRSRILQNRQGMVLMSSLTLLSVLMVAGIGAGVMLQNDFRVLSNLRGGTEAFYFSVSGLEWAKSEIARATNFPPIPANQS